MIIFLGGTLRNIDSTFSVGNFSRSMAASSFLRPIIYQQHIFCKKSLVPRRGTPTLFFGLSTRQFLCAILAVGTAVGVYFLLKNVIGQETASWVCIVAAVPIAVTGFFQYNGLTFEQFAWAFIKSQILCAGPRVFQSENIYLTALERKGGHKHD